MAMHYLMQTDTSEYGIYENHNKIELHINVSKSKLYINVIKTTLLLLWKLFNGW